MAMTLHEMYHEEWHMEGDDLIVNEIWTPVAIIDTKYVDDLTRIVSVLDDRNDLHIWKEDLLCGCGWFYRDRYVGYVSHEEMLSYNT